MFLKATCASIILLLLTFFPEERAFPQSETASLGLTIFAYDTSEPLANAAVQIVGTSLVSLSNSQGRSTIRGISPGRHVVVVRLLGFASERLTVGFEPGESVDIELDLLTQPLALPGVEVAVETNRILQRSGFLQRRRMTTGGFLSRDQFDIGGLARLSDILRRVRGVSAVQSSNGSRIVSERGGGRCPMPLFINGAVFPVLNVDDISIESVAGVEVYRGPAETPQQFRLLGQSCGAVVIWLR